MEPFLGQIILFAGNFAPRGWAFCNGQLLSPNQNSALFSILGTIYGGDGRTTFALPDLRGRVPISPGQGPGLSNYKLGAKGGVEEVVLTEGQLPSHKHGAVAHAANPVGRGGESDSPNNHYWAVEGKYATNKNTEMATDAVETLSTGGGLAHENRQPYLAVNYIIALQGTYPSRS